MATCNLNASATQLGWLGTQTYPGVRRLKDAPIKGLTIVVAVPIPGHRFTWKATLSILDPLQPSPHKPRWQECVPAARIVLKYLRSRGAHRR